jgi:hypothetical protein
MQENVLLQQERLSGNQVNYAGLLRRLAPGLIKCKAVRISAKRATP